jgi:membrane-associated phospholipid phosphatase
MDYFHHVSDIIAGGALGLFCAIIAYLSYYQNPLSKRAGQLRDRGDGRRQQGDANELL